MVQSDSQAMVKAFHYVRDVYRNISRMLLSCDPLMEEKGFLTDRKWPSIWPDKSLVLSSDNSSDSWLPYFVVRQYFNAKESIDLITLAAVVWDCWDSNPPRFDTPLCLASRMLVPDTASKELMWIGVIQMWDRAAKPDGELRVLSENSSQLPEWVRKD